MVGGSNGANWICWDYFWLARHLLGIEGYVGHLSERGYSHCQILA